jgi:hypothetical protein
MGNISKIIASKRINIHLIRIKSALRLMMRNRIGFMNYIDLTFYND